MTSPSAATSADHKVAGVANYGAAALSTTADSTRTFARFCEGFALSDLPAEFVERVKYLVLDGIACALFGAHLPWSAAAVSAIGELVGEDGDATVVGWGRRMPAPDAALLNGTFIQGFELDDYHPLGPLHGCSVVLPAAFATAETLGGVTGESFVEAVTLGFEIGPRVGMAMGGFDVVTRGWHSGAIFGTFSSAVTAGKLRSLSASGFEDALGIAGTQSSGLMAAHFEAMVKRMQHGFSARNGVYAAALAAHGFSGVKGVFDRPYGGFVSTFAAGHPTDVSRITAALGDEWEIARIAIKPHAVMAAMHSPIDAIQELRRQRPFEADEVRSVRATVAHAFHHACWKLERPAEVIGAQMNLAYTVAVVILDGQASAAQFTPTRIEADDVWRLMERVSVEWDDSIDAAGHEARWTAHVTVELNDGTRLETTVTNPRGSPSRPLSNSEIAAKYRELTAMVMPVERAESIARLVLTLETLPDASELVELLRHPVKSPFDPEHA